MHITPCETAWEPRDVALRLGHVPGLAWLDGGLAHGREGRFSFVSAAPCDVRAHAFGVPLSAEMLTRLATQEPIGNGPLAAEDVPRWVGHIAYDAYWSGHAGSRHACAHTTPVLRFARYDALFAFDHETGRGYLVGDDASACARLAARLEREPLDAHALAFATEELTSTAPEAHRTAITRALEHIRDGDVYEINLARRFRARFAGSALGLYLRMRDASPVPLGYFAHAGDHAVLGRSMERYLRFRARDRAVWTSPIKGTIARAGDDAREAHALVADPKEHAEHAMVVDLMRNDLSRVCEVGSVEVAELMAVLPFRGLSHLVSTVRGRARADLTLGDIVVETFPPGSVTGTPKRRAIELIDALEGCARGLYTGAYGFIDRAGGCSLAVAIRTAVVHGDEVEYFAGGGIVAASDPDKETAETELKARVFLEAIVRG